MAKNKTGAAPEKKRTYLKQTDVPGATLDEALRVPRAILDNYAGDPTPPLMVAQALSVDPNGTQLKVLSGAAIAYGLLEGGAQAASMSMTELAGRILSPTEEGMDLAARREAILRPRVFGDFLGKYNGKSIPPEGIGMNVLVEMGVPRDKSQDVFQRIISSAEEAGLISTIRDKRYLNLSVIRVATPSAHPESKDHHESDRGDESEMNGVVTAPVVRAGPANASPVHNNRIFVTHGKNKKILGQIERMIRSVGLEPAISVQIETAAKPVPQKVMDDMRQCSAVVIHVGSEAELVDAEGKGWPINPNVLIEIGAAMMHCPDRFVLVVEQGVELPSNLQGLYQCRYTGDGLDFDAVMKIQETLKGLK
ncbi:MAG TPA: TIR domain-containing protein [Blastocatellia bacterium]|nr:TIR domain-containing protein [Blastocatellia bacterium]